MHIYRSIFLILGCIDMYFHDLQFKKLLIYLILTLYTGPQFSLC